MQKYFGWRWILQILRNGYFNILKLQDFSYGEASASRYKVELKRQLELSSKMRLLSAIFKIFQLPILACILIRILDRCCLMALERILLGEVVKAIGTCAVENCSNWIFFAFVTITTARCVLHRIFYHWNKKLCKKIRTVILSMFYSKILTLSQKSFESLRTGDLVHLVSSGSTTLENTFFVPAIVTGPLQILTQFYILWTYFGVSSGIGLGVLILLGIWQSYASSLAAKNRSKIAAASAGRLRLMTQLIGGIKMIKLRGMEMLLYKLVGNERTIEFNLLKKSHFFDVRRHIINVCSPLVAMLVTIIIYVHFGHTQSFEQIIVAITIFYHLRVLIFVDIPIGVNQLGSMINVMLNFEQILLLEEFCPVDLHSLTFTGEIQIENLTLKNHGNNSDRNGGIGNVIKDGNLKVFSGELLEIVGKTGTGKTALLKAILGEYPPKSGKIKVGGRISYASQESWIFNGTIKENIIFHSKFDAFRYDQVLSVCALHTDLSRMPLGDQTMLSDGAELSGGQRSRVSLARTVYVDAEIYLLDDVLTNVDADVGFHIFHHCINGFLKNKTILLVSSNMTNQLYKFELLRNDILRPTTIQNFSETTLLKNTTENYHYATETSKVGEIQKLLPNSKQTVDVYWQYLTIGSGLKNVCYYVLATALFMIVYHGTEFKLQQAFQRFSPGRNLHNLEFVSGLILLLGVASLQAASMLRIITNASNEFHNNLLKSLLNAPLQFYTKNSTGEILERFAENLAVVDNSMPFKLHEAAHIFLMYLSAYFFAVYNFGLVLTIPLVLLFGFAFHVQKFDLKVCHQLTKLSHKAKEPLVTRITSTIEGISTIRALRQCRALEDEYDNYLDIEFRITYAYLTVHDLATLFIDLAAIGTLNLLVVGAMLYPIPEIAPVLSSLLAYGATLGYAFSLAVVLETNGKHAGDILQYHELRAEKEPAHVQETNLAEWPWNGKITFDQVSVEFEMKTLVLKNLSFTILPGENFLKIAIIGRTGGGKSTLISALVRLVEFTGEITIDGVNIDAIPLQQLRQKIYIVPQDPYHFHGTLRFYMDPFDAFSDADILKALSLVCLEEVLNNLPHGLSTEIHQNRNLLSCGQWQLVSLAKAVLAKPKILVMDEATAHIDENTSHSVLTKIQNQLPNSTLITVLHRLTHIHTYDRVMVINEGQIMAFGPPASISHLSSNFLNE